jgi:hypothetical protein
MVMQERLLFWAILCAFECAVAQSIGGLSVCGLLGKRSGFGDRPLVDLTVGGGVDESE